MSIVNKTIEFSLNKLKPYTILGIHLLNSRYEVIEVRVKSRSTSIAESDFNKDSNLNLLKSYTRAFLIKSESKLLGGNNSAKRYFHELCLIVTNKNKPNNFDNSNLKNIINDTKYYTRWTIVKSSNEYYGSLIYSRESSLINDPEENSDLHVDNNNNIYAVNYLDDKVIENKCELLSGKDIKSKIHELQLRYGNNVFNDYGYHELI